jgi:hypothetical protein
VKSQKQEFPLDERPVRALQLPPQPLPEVVEVSVAQQPAAHEKEARHVKHVNETAKVAGTATVARHHQQDANAFGNIQRHVTIIHFSKNYRNYKINLTTKV